MIYFCLASAIAWTCILSLPFRPWGTKELFSPNVDRDNSALDELTILIPARNEEKHIQTTLLSLRRQDNSGKIIVINDESFDSTAKKIVDLDLRNLELVNGTPPPVGWTGKVWALHQGFQKVTTPFVLLMDADIILDPKTLTSLLSELKQKKYHLMSIMAVLKTDTLWEKLLIPAFIYFFKMLYPFELSNRSDSNVAAAAGGLILIRTECLREIGGFEAIKDAIIDDCTLAKLVKRNERRTWIGLSHAVKTTRRYESIKTIWNMVARTAYTQLHYSIILLLISSFTLLIIFIAPLTGLVSGDPLTTIISIVSVGMMSLSFRPIIGFYRLSVFWCLTLPLSTTLFLMMTWTSAFRFWTGQRSHWKDRVYSK
ncbi:MAG: glycosyltransferase [Pseudomonadota bacterium]|nr:glycosyltransferase [Pseudomonadota bacterium]